MEDNTQPRYTHRDDRESGRHEFTSQKRHRHDGPDAKHKNKKRKGTIRNTDDDVNDNELWVEKNIDLNGELPLATDVPTAENLGMKSRAISTFEVPPPPSSRSSDLPLEREEWMLLPSSEVTVPFETADAKISRNDETLTVGYGETSQSRRNLSGSIDFFSTLGLERPKRPQPDRPTPDQLQISSKELNTQLKENKPLADYTEPPVVSKSIVPGGPGSQWRMMRLRRVYETAIEERRTIEDVAKDRFGSLEAFEQAKEERRILDERESRRAASGKAKAKDAAFGCNATGKGGERGVMYTDIGGASSRSSNFKRPGGIVASRPSTPSLHLSPPTRQKFDSINLPSQGESPRNQACTPIPSVMTPQASSSTNRALSPSSLNKLQAKVLRAKLVGAPDAETLEAQYEAELGRANGGVVGTDGSIRTRVEVLPTLDIRGRLYDVGHGKDDGSLPAGNRPNKEKVDTRDPRTGDIVQYNADDDTTSLGEMLRQERFGAGIADQKNLDVQFARSIATDAGFQNDLDYMDDNAERLGRQKMRSEAMKRQFAINDYKRTQKALASCPFCFGEDDSPPTAPVVALGTRVYLSCTLHEELVPGHCLIVPIQHHLAMLEGDDDVWDEVRNFMKSLMKMYSEQDKGVVFYETVLTLKWQKHTIIECVPVPWDIYDLLPGYFKESILMSETEWSQHKKLIDFSARGGFRRMMVPNLPYFMVQFDYKGEKGYGHVIEGTSEAADADGDEPVDEGEKGGGEFPRYFASEIIGNILELEPRRWRHPRRLDFRQNKDRVAKFKKQYENYDWTLLIGRT